MLFAFVGCKENTPEEKVQTTTTDFMRSVFAFEELGTYCSAIYGKTADYDLSKENYEESPDKANALTSIIQGLVGTSDVDTTQLVIKSKKGTITYSYEETKDDKGETAEISISMEAKDVEVEIEYKGDNKKVSFSLVSEGKAEYSEPFTVFTKVESLTLNGRTYKGFTVEEGALGNIVSATCDGKTVDIGILGLKGMQL